MKSPEEIRSELQKLADAEDWDGCLRVVRLLEEETLLTADELVRKSACLQLGSDLGSLEEAEQALRAALEIAKDYVPALLDLGWFHYSVNDDAETALSYFAKAEELSRASLKEALEGKEQCLEELQQE